MAGLHGELVQLWSIDMTLAVVKGTSHSIHDRAERIS